MKNATKRAPSSEGMRPDSKSLISPLAIYGHYRVNDSTTSSTTWGIEGDGHLDPIWGTEATGPEVYGQAEGNPHAPSCHMKPSDVESLSRVCQMHIHALDVVEVRCGNCGHWSTTTRHRPERSCHKESHLMARSFPLQ